MAVLTPRIRTIGVRLSDDEYAALERFCAESGARSISDLARAAIRSFISFGIQENALASTLNQNVAHVKELQQKIEMLSAEIALLRAISMDAESDKGKDLKGGVGLSEPESSPNETILDPDL